MKGGIKHELRAPVTPAEHQGLVAKNASLMDMRENLAYQLHASSSLRQIRIIGYKHRWQMAPAEIPACCHIRYKPHRNAVYHVAPVDVVLRHERLQDILLPHEHTVHDRGGVMRQSGNVEEWHHDEYLKGLEVCQLTVPALVASKTTVVQCRRLKEPCEVVHYGRLTFFCEKIANF